MTTTQTLLEIAGETLAPAALEGSCVLIIDAQRVYLDRGLPLDGVQPALGTIRRLLERSRAARVPIVHIVHDDDPGGMFDPADGGRIAEEAAPIAGEPVVRKRAISAFEGTDLNRILEARGRPSLVVAGFMTHMCVSSTVRSAFDRGLGVTVVADATATRALPGASGGSDVDAASLQRASLAALADLFAAVRPLDAIPA